MRSLLACWAIPLAAGALVGFGDALLSWVTGVSTRADLVMIVCSVSFGAATAFGVALPFTLAFAVPGRHLAAAVRLAATAVVLPASFPAFLILRSLYHRVPWDAGDFAFGIGGGLALLVAAILLTWLLALPLRRKEDRVVRSLARAGGPLLLLLLPVAWMTASGLRADPPPPGASTPGPNLLLLTVDTLRADHIGAYGDPRARTPWLDRLARRGTIWTDCLAPSPWTLPSLGTLLTGRYPGEHLVMEELSSLAENVTSIAEVARDEDYRTAAVVTNPWMSAGALARGFQHFDLAERFESFAPVHGTHLYSLVSRKIARAWQLDRADRTTARAVRWLRHTQGKWLLWAHYFDPHVPNWPDRPWDRLFGPPPRLIGRWMPIRQGRFEGGAAAEAEIARLYESEVAFTDAAIAPLVRELERRGELASTAIVFSADHGEEFWDHGGYEHGHTMFDELVRVPFFVVPPGGAAGQVNAALVRLVDLAPTALGAVGLAPEQEFTGLDALASPDGVPVTFGEGTLYGNEKKYLRAGRWKLVYEPDHPQGRVLRLYDLSADPAEQHDLVGIEPAVADSLFGILQDWMERVGSRSPMASQAEAGELDPVVRKQLESLGYFGGR